MLIPDVRRAGAAELEGGELKQKEPLPPPAAVAAPARAVGSVNRYPVPPCSFGVVKQKPLAVPPMPGVDESVGHAGAAP